MCFCNFDFTTFCIFIVINREVVANGGSFGFFDKGLVGRGKVLKSLGVRTASCLLCGLFTFQINKCFSD